MGNGMFDIANQTSGRLRGIHDTTFGTHDVAERTLNRGSSTTCSLEPYEDTPASGPITRRPTSQFHRFVCVGKRLPCPLAQSPSTRAVPVRARVPTP
jgi:hypothetical protein